jgi:isocitrate lyase
MAMPRNATEMLAAETGLSSPWFSDNSSYLKKNVDKKVYKIVYAMTMHDKTRHAASRNYWHKRDV